MRAPAPFGKAAWQRGGLPRGWRGRRGGGGGTSKCRSNGRSAGRAAGGALTWTRRLRTPFAWRPGRQRRGRTTGTTSSRASQKCACRTLQLRGGQTPPCTYQIWPHAPS
eukprot:545900-Pleurochrysis_carterae.AAC.1